jgi:hypothetical protein
VRNKYNKTIARLLLCISGLPDVPERSLEGYFCPNFRTDRLGKYSTSQTIFLGIILIFIAISAFTIPVTTSSLGTNELTAWESFAKVETTTKPLPQSEGFTPPSPDENPCLHCHIVGQEIGPLTPLYRWLSFGAMGMIFLFGITRSLSTWNTKEQWKPVGRRISELVNVNDPLAKTLDKPAPTWQRRLWYYLGGATALFFLIQIISGTIGAFHYSPLVFDEFTDTHSSLILSIKASHWGMGIAILATVLLFTIIGSFFSSEERSYWVIMLILTAVLGIPAIVQLTSGYLSPEVSIPPSNLYALHIMLISTLIATLTGMYLIVAYKKSSDGEIK